MRMSDRVNLNTKLRIPFESNDLAASCRHLAVNREWKDTLSGMSQQLAVLNSNIYSHAMCIHCSYHSGNRLQDPDSTSCISHDGDFNYNSHS